MSYIKVLDDSLALPAVFCLNSVFQPQQLELDWNWDSICNFATPHCMQWSEKCTDYLSKVNAINSDTSSDCSQTKSEVPLPSCQAWAYAAAAADHPSLILSGFCWEWRWMKQVKRRQGVLNLGNRRLLSILEANSLASNEDPHLAHKESRHRSLCSMMLSVCIQLSFDFSLKTNCVSADHYYTILVVKAWRSIAEFTWYSSLSHWRAAGASLLHLQDQTCSWLATVVGSGGGDQSRQAFLWQSVAVFADSCKTLEDALYIIILCIYIYTEHYVTTI